MAKTIKAENMQPIRASLIQLLMSLKSDKLQQLIEQLKQPKVIIPETKQSRDQACYFIYTLFTAMPELKTPANKEQVELFASRIGLATPSAKPQRTTKR